jgi:hypothetical protein
MNDNTNPPKGMLAGNALQDDAAGAAVAQDATKDTQSPAMAGRIIDPSYLEPTPLAKFQAMHDAVTRDEPKTTEELAKQNLTRKVLIDFLLGRVGQLEDALKPFCVTGTMFANAGMTLASLNRSDEPVGGTWISNPPANIQLQPTQGYFFAAIDAYGRKATETHMAAIFERVQASNKLTAEKDKHVEDGGTVH